MYVIPGAFSWLPHTSQLQNLKRNYRYWVTMDMETELRGTCHFARVNDVIFPAGCSDLFITCSIADIRVWNAVLRQELLRIQVRRAVCPFFCLPA